MYGGCFAVLVQYSEKKLKALERIRQLTVDQGKSIEKKDLEMLNRLTMEKQQIIDEINSYDDQFNHELANLKKSLGIVSLEELETCKDRGKEQEVLVNIIREILGLIGDIRKQEEVNYTLLKKAMEETRNNIKKIRMGKKALRGYNAPANTMPSGFVDKKK